MGSSQDDKTIFKFVQLCKAAKDNKIIEKILEQEGDINFAIPPGSPYRKSGLYFMGGGTILHRVAYTKDNFALFMNLLSHGADFTKKNEYGQTVLHTIIARFVDISESLDDRFINAVLSAHVSSKNFSNPCNKDGLSHFHIACMTNHSTAVQFFLDNGVSVDEPVTMDSKVSSGHCTPLHFAAMHANAKVAEILIAHGANMHIVDARGMTPLHVLVERRLEMYDSIDDAVRKNEDSDNHLQEPIEENEKIINMLLENTSIDNDCPDSIGLSNFHVACMLTDTSAAENLVHRVTDIDHCVNMDSPFWPGYTALHFAIRVSIEAEEMLINEGANVGAKDSNGLTPLDLYIDRYQMKYVCGILRSRADWKDILFSDGKTKLLSFIPTLKSRALFEKSIKFSINDINMSIPMDSPLWPGYTPLHLAVLFAERSTGCTGEDEAERIIKSCLKNGADLSVQDSRGRTALHLAYRMNNTTAVRAIIRYCCEIPNASDEDNLTHLHIVCAVGKKKRWLKKCQLNSLDVNAVYKGTSKVNGVMPGWTPLHASLVKLSDTHDLAGVIEALLNSGADPHVKDARGLTPVHLLLNFYSFSVNAIQKLLDRATTDCVAEEYGLSYLHVACKLNDRAAVKRLLDSGADANLAVKCTRRDEDDPLSFLADYDKYTPLHLYSDCSALLMEHGADVFAKRADGKIPLDYEGILKEFVSRLWRNNDICKVAWNGSLVGRGFISPATCSKMMGF